MQIKWKWEDAEWFWMIGFQLTFAQSPFLLAAKAACANDGVDLILLLFQYSPAQKFPPTHASAAYRYVCLWKAMWIELMRPSFRELHLILGRIGKGYIIKAFNLSLHPRCCGSHVWLVAPFFGGLLWLSKWLLRNHPGRHIWEASSSMSFQNIPKLDETCTTCTHLPQLKLPMEYCEILSKSYWSMSTVWGKQTTGGQKRALYGYNSFSHFLYAAMRTCKGIQRYQSYRDNLPKPS